MKRVLFALFVIMLSQIAFAATPLYAIGDYLDISLTIQQDHPDGEQYNKHLEYTIYDPAGKVVQTNKNGPLVLLSVNGDYTKRIGPENAIPSIRVAREWFTGEGASLGPYTFREWWNKASAGQELSAKSSLFSNPALKTKTGLLVTDTLRYVFDVRKKAGTFQYQIYRARGESAGSNGFSDLDQLTLDGCSGTYAPSKFIQCYPTETTVLTLTTTDKTPGDDEVFQTLITFNPPAPKVDVCSPVKITPQEFKMGLVIYDSDKYGEPTDQTSLDPYTGKDATYTVSFNAACVDNTSPLLKAAKERLEGKVPITEAVLQTDTLLRDFVNKETVYQSKIYGYIREPDPLKLVKSSSDIISLLYEFSAQETRDAEKLKPLILTFETYVKNLPEIDSNKQIYRMIVQLYDNLRQLNVDNNVDAVLTETSLSYNLKFIADYLQQTPSLKHDDIRNKLRVLLEFIEPTIELKKSIISKLSSVVGAPGGNCPEKGALEKDGYYMCAPFKPEAIWKDAPSRTCLTKEKQFCFVLPTDNLCDGLKGEYNYACKYPQDVKLAEGWETYYLRGQVAGEPFSPQMQLGCVDTSKQCYRQSIYGSRISSIEQLALIRQHIRGLSSKLSFVRNELVRKSQLPNEELLEFFGPPLRDEVAQQLVPITEEDISFFDTILKRPLSGKPLLSENIAEYQTGLSAIKTNLEMKQDEFLRTTTVDALKKIFIDSGALMGSFVNPPLISTIDSQFGSYPSCPIRFTKIFEGAYEQYDCFDASCPSQFTFAPPLSWFSQQFKFSCSGSKICCSRAVGMTVALKNSDGALQKIVLPLTIKKGSKIDLILLVPYGSIGDIDSVSYSSNRYAQLKKLDVVPDYKYDPLNKFASIVIPQITIDDDSQPRFTASLKGDITLTTQLNIELQ